MSEGDYGNDDYLANAPDSLWDGSFAPTSSSTPTTSADLPLSPSRTDSSSNHPDPHGPPKRGRGRPAKNPPKVPSGKGPGRPRKSAAAKQLTRDAAKARADAQRAEKKAAEEEAEREADARREAGKRAHAEAVEAAEAADPKRFPKLDNLPSASIRSSAMRKQQSLPSSFFSRGQPTPASSSSPITPGPSNPTSRAASSAPRPRASAFPSLDQLNPIELPQPTVSEPRRLEPLLASSTRSASSGGESGSSDEELFGGEGIGQPDGGDEDEQPLGGTEELEDDEPAPTGRRAHPQWVTDRFERHKEYLRSTLDPKTYTTALHRPINDSMDPTKRGIGTFFLPEPSLSSSFYNGRMPQPHEVYPARFYYWDPFPLVQGGATCPSCRSTLTRHGFSNRPRRVCDLDSVIYLFGQRYRCRGKSGDKGCGTFIAWDRRLLAQVPQFLLSDFPFVLSYRGGCTVGVFNAYRMALQHGTGPVAFASSLRRQHQLEYDRRRVAYLQAIADRHFDGSGTPKFDPEHPPAVYSSFSSFDDSNGYYPYVPSSKWLQAQYVRFILEHKVEMEQHISMLSCQIMQMDHSHKITKFICRVEGQPVFIGLLSVTNEYGELKVCNLVPTKSHDSFVPALEAMKQHLELYGHPPVKIVYTDNVGGDGGMLRSVFESLNNVAPAVDGSSRPDLPSFPTPSSSSNSLVLLSTLSTTNNALDSLLALSERDEVVGLDIEWNVAEGPFGAKERGEMTAVVQVAWREQVFVIQLARIYRREKSLPLSLLHLLLSESVVKAGVQVSQDVSLLLKDFRNLLPQAVPLAVKPVKVLELAALAKEKGVKMSRYSLDSLVAGVLKQNLPKPSSLRISTMWEADALS
ncbi:hypothetical protein JCM8097_008210 [Rhodosporidiobolus ruineniae]